jgi:uncharacterized protein HemY
MKMNKQITKKINSPKTAFIFLFLVVIALIVIHFVFRSIRVIFDMDKKADTKINDAKIKADGNNNPTTNSNSI